MGGRSPLRRRPIDDDLPATVGDWALLIGQATLGLLFVWAWLVLFLTAFS